MEDILVFTDFLVAIALGALIGMEREMDMWKAGVPGFAGVRTFVLITLLGALVAYISRVFGPYYIIFISAAFIGFTIFISTSYYVTARFHKKIGATTEMTALLAFVIGMMCLFELKTLAVAVTILITTFLALKNILHGFAHKINRRELYATLEFLIVALVVLPFLPNQQYGPFEAFNPYNIWLMVVFVSAISYVGYILIKWKGSEKGLGLLGLVGGLVSSTAVASAMAAESKKLNYGKPFASTTIIASTVMFLRLLFIVYILNREIIPSLIIPLGAMILSGLGFILLMKNSPKKAPAFKFESPLAMAPALKFAAIFAVVLFVSKFSQFYYGASGIYVVAVLAGLLELNAITISIAGLSLLGVVPVNAAAIAITLAVISNSIVKIWIGYLFGSKDFAKRINLAYAAIILVGIIAMFFI